MDRLLTRFLFTRTCTHENMNGCLTTTTTTTTTPLYTVISRLKWKLIEIEKKRTVRSGPKRRNLKRKLGR